MKSQLYDEDLNKYYLDDSSNNILSVQPARGSNIDSKLITNKIAAYIASWIDRKENLHPIYGFTPYPFKCFAGKFACNFKNII